VRRATDGLLSSRDSTHVQSRDKTRLVTFNRIFNNSFVFVLIGSGEIATNPANRQSNCFSMGTGLPALSARCSSRFLNSVHNTPGLMRLCQLLRRRRRGSRDRDRSCQRGHLLIHCRSDHRKRCRGCWWYPCPWGVRRHHQSRGSRREQEREIRRCWVGSSCPCCGWS
jgi:hypothetical protein